MTEFVDRRAARVLLLDDEERVLLFRGWDPARPEERYWFTPGGGLEPGESSAVGAARELAEETGLRIDPAELGEPVWREVTEFPFDGRWFRQVNEFFVLRRPGVAVDTSGFDEVERGCIDIHRWWSVADLATAEEPIYPGELPDLLTRICPDRQPC